MGRKISLIDIFSQLNIRQRLFAHLVLHQTYDGEFDFVAKSKLAKNNPYLRKK